MGNCRSFSKGCRTCVRRKVKCDETRPVCHRCVKGRLVCEMYKETTFVDSHEQVMNRIRDRMKVSGATASQHHRNASSITANAAVSVPQRAGNTPTEYRPIFDPGRPFPSPTIDQDEIFLAYTLELLGSCPLAMINSSLISSCGASTLNSQQLSMRHCLLALATVFYGVQNREKGILSKGLGLYVRALSTLRSLLGNHVTINAEIIASIWLLSICEASSIMPSSKSSWMTHIRGLESLFASRGPLKVSDTPALDRALLEACRPVMILAAFFTQTPSLMSEPTWKASTQLESVPQSDQASNSAADWFFLMEILADLPPLYLECGKCVQDANGMPRCPQTARASMIRARALGLQQRLLAWKQDWNLAYDQMKIHKGLTSSAESELVSNNTEDTHSVASVNFAITFALFHSVVILLKSLLRKLSLISRTADCLSADAGQCYLYDIKASILSIHQSSQYLLQSPEPSKAPADYYLFFPIHVAWRASNQLNLPTENFQLSEAYALMKLRYPTGVWANMDFGDRFSGLLEGLFG